MSLAVRFEMNGPQASRDVLRNCEGIVKVKFARRFSQSGPSFSLRGHYLRPGFTTWTVFESCLGKSEFAHWRRSQAQSFEPRPSYACGNETRNELPRPTALVKWISPSSA
jgi:hypothetical protein